MVQVLRKYKNGVWQTGLKLTGGRDEGVKVLVTSCITKMDSTGMKMKRKSWAAGPRQGENPCS